MPALNPQKSQVAKIELMRDQCVVIDQRGGDPVALKRARAKMRRILKTMPMNAIDSVAEVRKIRDSGGRS